MAWVWRLCRRSTRCLTARVGHWCACSRIGARRSPASSSTTPVSDSYQRLSRRSSKPCASASKRKHAPLATFQRAVRHDSRRGRGSPPTRPGHADPLDGGVGPTPPPDVGLFLSVSPLRHKAKRLARGYVAAHNVAARIDPERAGGCRSGEVDGDVVSVHGLDKTVEPGRVMLYAGDLVRGVHVPRSREIAARDDE